MTSRTTLTPLTAPLFNDLSQLHLVQAQFVDTLQTTFEELIAGYSFLRVLTYSNSVSIVTKAAELVDELEIIFGREDIVNEMAKYLHYQELLIEGVKAEIKGNDTLKHKIEAGKIRLRVVRDIISHEKLFLLEGERGTRVVTGSANFSEKAFSGNQNESFICFDNDAAAWDYFSAKYERIKASSTAGIAKRAILDDAFDVEHLPALNPDPEDKGSANIIIIQDRPPTPNIIHKLISQRTPKQYEGLNQIVNTSKGVARISRQIATQAIQYIRSNSRTETENPEEFLSIYPETGRVVLSGRELDLDVPSARVKADVELLVEYFEGYSHFRGNVQKLAADYFTFMSWFYISPFICDFRNRALANLQDELNPLEYPVFGILYGKSNCGKSELIRTLLFSMFEQEGFLPNEWFTRTQVLGLREQNRRFPMVFDDLDKERFSKYAIPLIKEDYMSMREYPATVLSMNADKDRFETEVRKRCLIVYTDAALPDHTHEMRDLGIKLRRMKRSLGNSLYREYLRRVLAQVRNSTPRDVLQFSSTILVDLFSEHYSGELPTWCHVTSMDEYIHTKHDKIKDELLQIVEHNRAAWSESGNLVVLRLEKDIHTIGKLAKDIPDYLIRSKSGDVLVFYKAELEEFLEQPIFPKRRLSRFWAFRRRR